MANQLTLDSLRQVARTYLRARGEPTLRDATAAIHETTTLSEQATELIQRARRVVEISKTFRDGHMEDSIPPCAWDDLVLDYFEEDI